MKREADAARLLNNLLDRFERASYRSRRIIARASLSFESAAAHRQLDELLTGARDAGAVELIFDREAPHLVDRVVLLDAVRLYAYLDRRPAEVDLAAALSRLQSLAATTDVGRALAAHMAERWSTGQTAVALAPAEIDQAISLVRAADAAFTQLAGGRLPLRTRSARLLGDSKALERSLSKLLAFLRDTGRIDPDLSREEALRVLGLEKFPQPILAAGPLLVGGLTVAGWTYVGLPPEAGDAVEAGGHVRSILTIENLESFNRHVRECREPADAVVYTGGFPSAGVIAVLRRLIALSDVPCVWHWGDIDGGGLKIGCYLERMLPRPVVPHLMSADLATSHGKTVPPLRDMSTIPPGSAFGPLAAFLSSPAARCLEQEMLDPEPVPREPFACGKAGQSSRREDGRRPAADAT